MPIADFVNDVCVQRPHTQGLVVQRHYAERCLQCIR